MAITIEQLKAALERRGYTVRTSPRRENAALVTSAIYRNAGPLTPETPVVVRSFSLYDLAVTLMDAGQMAEELLTPLSDGQHHTACAQCGEPLLQASGREIHPLRRYGPPPSSPNFPDRSHHIHHFAMETTAVLVYRSAKAGPGSPALSTCPACHSRLSKETVKEIEDS